MEQNKRKDKTRFETNVISIGGSLYISLPKEIQNHTDVQEGDQLKLMAEFAEQHGSYISLWNPDQQKNSNLKKVQE